VAKAKSGRSIKSVAAELGVSAKWIRAQVGTSAVTPGRSSDKRNARYLFSEADIATLRALALHPEPAPTAPPATAENPAPEPPAVLARVTQLEAERANLIAQVAWERAIAQEQQKALEAERARTAKLAADLELQHSRIEALKALSAWDRVIGRHKAV
jgi:hypothetical protein